MVRLICSSLQLNIRSFVSVDVSIKDQIGELQNRIIKEEELRMQQVKPVDKQNLHFSIFFLGEISPETVDILKSRLSDLIFKPFTVTYTGLGVFSSAAKPRTIWMGTDAEGGKKLRNLSQMVVTNIKDVVKADKPFIPHVTLFRIKNGRLRVDNMLRKYKDISFGSDLIDRIHIKKSELTQSGPIYSVMDTVCGR
jgi:RNA 2',3'-cyclic 3'-phosphodiesterase